jgi:ParB family chromosome partitioning protein
MIVQGERRFKAHRKLGHTSIKAIVSDMPEKKARDIQLVENIERKDLSDIELCWEFERRVGEGQTHEQIAGVIGKTRSYVSQRLKLLRLSEAEQQKMLRGELSFSQARVLLSMKDHEKRDRISKTIDRSTPVRKLKSLVKEERIKHEGTRVPFGSQVNVRLLTTGKTILDEYGSLREAVPRQELIKAMIEDLKVLRRR